MQPYGSVVKQAHNVNYHAILLTVRLELDWPDLERLINFCTSALISITEIKESNKKQSPKLKIMYIMGKSGQSVQMMNANIFS
uniref:Uncharacterized protein n=1 Tax=Onchocerca volvulus TaxID=6282 RepID=A0A8R1TT43_ONCVO